MFAYNYLTSALTHTYWSVICHLLAKKDLYLLIYIY